MTIKNRAVLNAGLVALGALALSSSIAAAQESGPPDEVTHWVFQPAFDSSDAGWDNGLMPWVKAVEEATEGTVQIEVQPAGALVSGGEAFGAAVAGMTDGYAGWATVYGGVMPEGMLAYGLAMGAESTEQAWELMWGNPDYRIGELVQEAAHERNVHSAGWTNQGPNAMFTTFPVETLEDFKGKKMRASGPQALFHEAIGGVPVSMGAGDIYTGIKLGTIEGTYWDTGGIDDMSFDEVVEYAVMPGWNPAQHQEIYVNLDSWNALTPWQQEKIEGIFKSTYFETSKLHAEQVDAALKVLEAEGGKVVHLSDEQVQEMRRISIEEVWPQVAEKSDLNAKGVELYKKYLQETGK